MTELLSCPFCGGGAVISADMTDYPQIACDACAATGPASREKGIYPAIAAWNRRTPAKSVNAALEYADEAERAQGWTLAPSFIDRIAKEAERLTGYGYGAASEFVEPTHRHKKRGTEYVLLGIGKMQAERWYEHEGAGDYVPIDMREVAIYRSVDDGSLWARPREEFDDGRFEALPAAPRGGRE